VEGLTSYFRFELKMRTATFLTVLFAASSLLSQSESPETVITLPDAKYLFSLSSSPLEPTLFLVSSPDERNEDGDNAGTPVIVGLGKSGRPVIKTLSAGRVGDGDTAPVWSRDGKTVYFVTERGIFSYGVADDHLEKIWGRTARGLAVAQNGRYIAFWNLSEQDWNHFKLILFDLKYKREKQSWVIPNDYGGDEDWFDLAFAADDRSIYASTFDEEGPVPLKRFTIGEVKPEVVAKNITGVVAGQKGVYFVTERLDNQTLIYTLMAVSDSSGTPQQIKTNLPCRGLTASGSLRWLVCKDYLAGKPKLLFDSAEGVSTPFNPSCDNVVVMANGEFLCSVQGTLRAGNILH
jgi:hypothetical protein